MHYIFKSAIDLFLSVVLLFFLLAAQLYKTLHKKFCADGKYPRLHTTCLALSLVSNVNQCTFLQLSQMYTLHLNISTINQYCGVTMLKQTNNKFMNSIFKCNYNSIIANYSFSVIIICNLGKFINLKFLEGDLLIKNQQTKTSICP